MGFLRTGLAVASALLVVAPAANADGMHHKKAAHHSSFHAPAQMTSARATEIQTALIKAHYMDGSPTGVWDEQSKSAMTRYQQDNGWQTKTTPDSRALIKLGLGPDQTGAAPVSAAAATTATKPATSTPQNRNSLGSAIASQQEWVLNQ